MREASFEMGCGFSFTVEDLTDNYLTFVPIEHKIVKGEMVGNPMFRYRDIIYATEYVDLELSGLYDWQVLSRSLRRADGVMIFTGKQSPREFGGKDFYRYDIDIEHAMVRDFPEITQEMIRLYEEDVRRFGGTPCIVRTKSNGRRLVGYTEDVYSEMKLLLPKPDKPKEFITLVEFFSTQKWSTWDNRYSMLKGDPLNAPRISDELRRKLGRLVITVEGSEYRIRDDTTHTEFSEVTITDGLGEKDIQFVDKGVDKYEYIARSRWYSTTHCRVTEHESQNESVRYYLYEDGSIVGHCYNCEQRWVEKKAVRKYARSNAQVEYLEQDIISLILGLPKQERLDAIIKEIRKGEKAAQFKSALRRRIIPLEEEKLVQKLWSEQEQNATIDGAFASDAKFVILIAQTGSGKSTTARRTLEYHIAIVPTVSLREEYCRLVETETGRIAYSWKPYTHGCLFVPDDIPEWHVDQWIQEHLTLDVSQCHKPVARRMVDEKGLNSRGIICETSCPYLDDCRDIGYHSQIPKAQAAHVVVISLESLFTSPTYEGILVHLMHIPDDEIEDEWGEPIENNLPVSRVIFKDEIPSNYFFEEVAISIEKLKATLEMWGMHFDIGRCVYEILSILEIYSNPLDKIRFLRAYILELVKETPKKAKRIIQDFGLLLLPCSRKPLDTWFRIADGKGNLIEASNEKVVIYDKEFYVAKNYDCYRRMKINGIPVVKPINERFGKTSIGISPDEAIRLGIQGYDFYTDEDPAKLPDNVYAYSHMTPLKKLESLFTWYIQSPPENVPMEFEEDLVKFAIPPSVSEYPEQYFLASATMSKMVTDRIFPDAEYHEVGDAEWVDDSLSLQIDSGNYALLTLSNACEENNWEPTDISDVCAEFLKLIMREVETYPERHHVVITMLKLIPLIEKSLGEYPDNLRFYNYEQVPGLYEEFEDMETLFLLGTPFVSHDIILQSAKRLFGDDAESFNLNIDKVTGEYTDSRLQEVKKIIVVHKMQQAFGRAELQRKPRRVVVLSSLRLPGISERSTRFLPIDWHCADDVQDIPRWSIPHLEEDRRIAKQLESVRANDTVEEVMEKTETQNKNTAYSTKHRLHGKSNKEEKTRRDERIEFFFYEGMSNSEIAKKVDLPRSTVYKVLKKLGLI